ncbi:MAG TPA: twin-arginine translocase TatA/TatE family subunit [Deltaproteobacteria bacterium]|jgi:sec-independent protein translocase protein TatB|nr:twin-arginine translocase TatA/TatE family subunit [Deltaproteobacteria bacterium]MDI9542923.1 twin-arginine translocase TatA/TatE family subunit [Pseudomonadota bacterium]NLW68515.1 twin-arginine translocase subunit TatB [Bacteriovoracaceae bacterium]HRR20444.1 twin-arginine translocase TatA/TatE family subunit [Desulfomonilia bacterium]HNU75213.1 twin-arginine translocase TatA/TatE family subunit [Deltaproteobacteria bacterium]
MFGIGGQELLLILLLALIILGPKKLPEMAKTIGKAMGEFQRATNDLKREIDVASRETPAEPAAPASKQGGTTAPNSASAPVQQEERQPEKKKSEDELMSYRPGEIEE